MNLEVHIEELGLPGFDPASSMAIAAAVERVLRQLLAERGLPPTLCQEGTLTQRHGGALTVLPGAPAEALGAQLAQAIYGSLRAE